MGMNLRSMLGMPIEEGADLLVAREVLDRRAGPVGSMELKLRLRVLLVSHGMLRMRGRRLAAIMQEPLEPSKDHRDLQEPAAGTKQAHEFEGSFNSSTATK